MTNKAPILRKNLEKGISAEANLDGTIFIDKSVKKGSDKERSIIAHEEHHLKQFKAGELHYNDFTVVWQGETYKRKDGMIEYNGKFYPEGHSVFPWEQEAEAAEHPYCMACFDTSELKKIKPPKDNSFDTTQEIKELQRIITDKSFVLKHDDMPKAFARVAKKKNVKDFDKDLSQLLIDKSGELITDLKNYFNRPRPKVLADKMNLKLDVVDLVSAKSMSYPSGHSAQAFLIAKILGDKYPKAREAFKYLAKKISYSRRVAHVHYKSDSKFGEMIGNALYIYIKNKT